MEASPMKASRIEEPSSSVVGCSNDLLPEILIHLPARTLVRFKLVSKQWLSLISDRDFAIRHSRSSYTNTNSRAPCGVFVYYHFYKSRGIENVSVPLFGNGTVPPLSLLNQFAENFDTSGGDIRSCNGLLLCTFFNRNLVSDLPSKIRCVVFNPTTRDFKVLPSLPEIGKNESFEGLTLAFNPSESHHYKVLGIKRFHSKYGQEELYIYSSETDSWKFGRVIAGLERCKHVAFLNGIVYWMGWRYMHYYNIDSEDVGRLDIPEVFSNETYFAESCGHLYLAFSLFRPRQNKIFEFHNSTMQWLDPHVEVLEAERFGWKKRAPDTNLLAVVKGKSDKDFVILHTTTKRLIISDVVLHRKVQALLLPRVCPYKACEYIQSLAPV